MAETRSCWIAYIDTWKGMVKTELVEVTFTAKQAKVKDGGRGLNYRSRFALDEIEGKFFPTEWNALEALRARLLQQKKRQQREIELLDEQISKVSKKMEEANQ